MQGNQSRYGEATGRWVIFS